VVIVFTRPGISDVVAGFGDGAECDVITITYKSPALTCGQHVFVLRPDSNDEQPNDCDDHESRCAPVCDHPHRPGLFVSRPVKCRRFI
jgi:hypothetical protein